MFSKEFNFVYRVLLLEHLRISQRCESIKGLLSSVRMYTYFVVFRGAQFQISAV